MISCSNHKEALISCSLAWDGCWSLFHHIWSLQLTIWKLYWRHHLKTLELIEDFCVSSCCVCLRCVVKPSIVETPNLTILPNLIPHNFLVDLIFWFYIFIFLISCFQKVFQNYLLSWFSVLLLSSNFKTIFVQHDFYSLHDF